MPYPEKYDRERIFEIKDMNKMIKKDNNWISNKITKV